MKKYVEIEPICPFIGKACIRDGWQWNASTYHPCAFYDESVFSKDCYPQVPCRIQRAIDRILFDEQQDTSDNDAVLVPWDVEGGKANVRKTKVRTNVK